MPRSRPPYAPEYRRQMIAASGDRLGVRFTRPEVRRDIVSFRQGRGRRRSAPGSVAHGISCTMRR